MVGRTIQLLIALLPATAYAFSDTHPIVAWSSHSSNAFEGAASAFKATNPKTVFASILLNDNVCEHDAVILVDQRGQLHASDLRALSPSSALAQSLNFAASTLELPYMPRSILNPFSNLAAIVADHCGAQVMTYDLAQGDAVSEASRKYVVCVEMPSLDNVDGAERKSMVAEHESQLSSSLARLADAFPKHLVVYAGWHPSLYTRQLPSPFSSSSLTLNSTSAFAPPSGGILARYQLLTPGLILSLLVGFFVLVPTVMLGVSALAGIKSPLQGEPPKGFIAAEKKNQ